MTSSYPLAPADESAQWNLEPVIQALRVSREEKHKIRHNGRVRELPSREALTTIVNGLSAALFPTHYGRPNLTDESIDYFVGDTLNTTLNRLSEQVRRGLLFSVRADDESHAGNDDAALAQQARDITRAFAASLPGIRALLVSDVQAAYAGDPAATSVAEIMLCYPGTIAILYHRLAHQLHVLGSPFLARLIADIAHTLTGIDIHPGAQIGASFFIDHGTGVVIGETAIIGQRVRLYQAVTLGAKRFPADDTGALIKGTPRHPIVEDDVVIYAGATVLGRIIIGAGSTVGGNVWLTHSVPAGSNVSQAQTRSD
ncbi:MULTISPECIES: serine O-acetyltransferase EpsC [unclassified Janthinobacterium]|uniref:serine O-acetyltransferase EpsC n=1 Tax=unclassified Janthinobacterium TaxID=2610881 RepID=UPI001608FEE4|nr:MULTISPECIES: serine O-acetyltransferase EpsC [unclassified Janthinobacterium]MBB5368926.1 serine O-acetyltransferase [Janthinobacterium sp. K2C7]MBB5381538.1 serine O-acetyltransferase [Janthinobacterium sp. K2Li3]MBB5387308.1 serine O-acetyltransferase [Janthinobacterium sp. K2E3]